MNLQGPILVRLGKKQVILNAMTNTLYDMYSKLGTAIEIWNSLIKKYIVENVKTKKYTVVKILDFKMNQIDVYTINSL